MVVELRTRERVAAMGGFTVLVGVLFNYAIDPTVVEPQAIASGLIWMTIIFGGMLGLGRTFHLEEEEEAFQGILLSPIPRDALYLGKVLANFILLAVVTPLVFGVFALFFGLDFGSHPVALAGVVLLGILGFVAVGTLFSAISARTSMGDTLLPILVFPVADSRDHLRGDGHEQALSGPAGVGSGREYANVGSVRRGGPGGWGRALSVRRGGVMSAKIRWLGAIFGVVWAWPWSWCCTGRSSSGCPRNGPWGWSRRIFYIHVPAAWVAFMAFGIVAICSAIYLWLKDERLDMAAVAAAEGGMLFTTIVLLTGPLWGRVAWGTWWTWEPRLTLTLLLWFIYLGYFLVRSSTENPEKGKTVRRRGGDRGRPGHPPHPRFGSVLPIPPPGTGGHETRGPEPAGRHVDDPLYGTRGFHRSLPRLLPLPVWPGAHEDGLWPIARCPRRGSLPEGVES